MQSGSTNVLQTAQVQQDFLNCGKRQQFESAQNSNAIGRSQRTLLQELLIDSISQVQFGSTYDVGNSNRAPTTTH